MTTAGAAPTIGKEARPDPPYPADTKAKGWRFELDYERIEQSGTWSDAMLLAMDGLQLARPLLLAMWYAAWKQVPCGSLPSGDRELAGAIGIQSSLFAEYRQVLLRGWWEARDGRLYHSTITSLVLEMMSKRRSDADRQARRRQAAGPDDAQANPARSRATQADVTRDTDANPTAVQRESSTDHRPLKRISKASPSHPPAGGKGARFMEFWTAWPKSERKQDRAKCWERWRAKDLDTIADTILADVRVKRGTTKWQEGYMEAPLVYLRGRRWEDGVEPDEGNPGEGVEEWHESVKGVVAMGEKLGLGGWTQPEWEAGKLPAYPVYKARVLRAAGVEPRRAA